VTIVVAASPAIAGRQGSWIASMEPWRGLGYAARGLGRFLSRTAGAGQVWVASEGSRGTKLGLLVLQPSVLLGDFVALLAVRPEAAGRGIGRALMARAEVETFANRRWLFVSADVTNHGALRFYRKLGFARVGRLPDLVRDGRTEILLRKGRPDKGVGVK
jgi:ribosomal protein S18 acetylase RimI-like enzyme